MPGGTLKTALASACAAVVALTAAPAAEARKGMEAALWDDPVLLARHYYDRDRALQNARELGVTRVRVFVNWAGVMGKQREQAEPPAEPTFHWAIYEELIDAAARAGIRVQLDLAGPAPRFATGDKELGMTRPDPAQFAVFARAAATRFKGRVDRYSVWNEPNHDGWLRPSAEAPQLYRSLYVAGYDAIKQADPSAQVLFGETAPYHGTRAMAPLSFLRRTLCLTARWKLDKKCLAKMPENTRKRLVTDGYAHHPYDFRNPPTHKYKGADNVTMGTLSRLTKALDRAARAGALWGPAKKKRGPDVFLTEFGYFTTGPRATIPEKKRAAYLPRAYAIALKNKRVRQMLHYSLAAPPEGYPGSAFDFGLVLTDGSPRATYGPLVKWAQRALAKKQIAAPGGPLALPAAQPGADPPGEPPPGEEEPPIVPLPPFP